MTVTAFSGPVITFQDGGVLANTSANQNPDQGPSLFLQATGLLDPRAQYTYYPGMDNSPVGFSYSGSAINAASAVGWINAQFQIADYAPGTASTTSLVSSANVSVTTSVTLTTSNTYAVTTNSSLTNASTGAAVTGQWLIDNTPSQISFGSGGAVSIWDPTNPPIGRAISVSCASGNTASTFSITVTGYDTYGYPITQTMTGPAASSTVYTGKTFKWVSSVAASTTSATTFSVGVADIYGLPFYATALPYVQVYWNNGAATDAAGTTFTAGVTTTTAGSSDVRGTIQLGTTASNGTVKMIAWQYVSPKNISTVSGLFGTFPPA